MRTIHDAAMTAAAALLLSACATAPKPAGTWEGLELYPQKKFDAVYLRPHANLARYSEIMLDPLEVSFDRNWNPNPTSAGLQRVDTARIKRALADEFRKVFTEVLSADGKYRIVGESGPATLHITPEIIDLYINAPDVSLSTAGSVRMYTVEPGRMTLAAEFRDGASGTLLARVVDRKEGVDRGYLQITNAVTNLADARQVMARWARTIREGLDTARAMAGASGN
ncbi:MAG: hypothetical protein CMLOHMNK_03591 [Steroidobacteraceae bacterium]|nr:hypothetical protein [Steroidobacteraceae bacterium]